MFMVLGESLNRVNVVVLIFQPLRVATGFIKPPALPEDV
jgi:hypothetical protein